MIFSIPVIFFLDSESMGIKIKSESITKFYLHMKLKQVALTLLAALTASASLYAQNEKVYITKGMAETEVWEDEYGTRR